MFDRIFKDMIKGAQSVVSGVSNNVNQFGSNVSNSVNSMLDSAARGNTTSMLNTSMLLGPGNLLANQLVGGALAPFQDQNQRLADITKGAADRLRDIKADPSMSYNEDIARFLSGVTQMRRITPGEIAKKVGGYGRPNQGPASLLAGGAGMSAADGVRRSLL
jgi:phage-related protein